MRKFADRCRRFWEGFLNGPRWFSVPSAGKKGRYVSSSLMLFLWIYALLDRFLTPQGRMFGAVYLAVSFYSMILTRSPAVVLFFVLSGVIFFNLITGLLFFPRIRLRAKFPPVFPAVRSSGYFILCSTALFFRVSTLPRILRFP